MYRILSVEDNLMNVNLLRRYLKDMDVQIFEAETGKDAIRIAENEVIDLVLLDYHLPDMNGREVAKLLRQMPHFKAIPIIAITADDTGILFKQLMSEGFDEVLYKPVSTSILTQTIEQHLHASIHKIA